MARKFLYIITIIALVIIATMFALRLWPGKLSELALVPDRPYEQPAPVPAGRYADLAMWISRPERGAGDPARWLPQSAAADSAPVAAAVFFVHPTSYLDKAHWNAPLDDAASRNLADTMVRGLASPFNRAAQLWVPRYRQATFGAFLSDKPEALQALDLAYSDVTAAFDQFLASIPAKQPIVLAGHSQGAYHLRRLLADRVAGKPLARRIAAV
jgi:hypothetical protein